MAKADVRPGDSIPNKFISPGTQCSETAKSDKKFWHEIHYFLRDYVGRPSPLYFSERLTNHFGGAKIYLKRDELNHTGAHKINNVLGQILLA